MAGTVFSHWRDVLPWVPLQMAGPLLTHFLVMASVFLAARLLLPDDFHTGEPEPLRHAVQAALTGLGIGAVFLATAAPILHLTLAHMLPPLPRWIWVPLAAVLLWPYIVQEEAVRAAVAGGGRHLLRGGWGPWVASSSPRAWWPRRCCLAAAGLCRSLDQRWRHSWRLPL